MQRNRSFIVSVSFVFVFFGSGYGQDKTIKYDSQTWFQYFLNARLSDKWSGNFDAGYRRNDEFLNKPLQWLLRAGATYHISNDVSFTAGYAYFSLHTVTSKNEFDRSEHRPWLRFTVAQKFGKLQIQHRYRFEMRNIQKNDVNGLLDDYNSYFRAGYQLNLQYVLNGEKLGSGIFYLIAQDEAFINFGTNVLNYFDQNRIYFGLGYGITKNTNFTLGYQYIYFQQNATTFANLNTLRINIIQNIDFRKPKEEPQSDLK
jgi:hypothetical protein